MDGTKCLEGLNECCVGGYEPKEGVQGERGRSKRPTLVSQRRDQRETSGEGRQKHWEFKTLVVILLYMNGEADTADTREEK